MTTPLDTWFIAHHYGAIYGVGRTPTEAIRGQWPRWMAPHEYDLVAVLPAHPTLADYMIRYGAPDSWEIVDGLACLPVEWADRLVVCRSDTGDGGWSLHWPDPMDDEDEDEDTIDWPLASGEATWDEDEMDWTAPTQADRRSAIGYGA